MRNLRLSAGAGSNRTMAGEVGFVGGERGLEPELADFFTAAAAAAAAAADQNFREWEDSLEIYFLFLFLFIATILEVQYPPPPRPPSQDPTNQQLTTYNLTTTPLHQLTTNNPTNA